MTAGAVGASMGALACMVIAKEHKPKEIAISNKNKNIKLHFFDNIRMGSGMAFIRLTEKLLQVKINGQPLMLRNKPLKGIGFSILQPLQDTDEKIKELINNRRIGLARIINGMITEIYICRKSWIKSWKKDEQMGVLQIKRNSYLMRNDLEVKKIDATKYVEITQKLLKLISKFK